MNVIKTFEQRMNDAFGAAPQGYSAPISFRKLAKRAAREMEAETFVVNGINTAPALYTILVSSTDDAAMRALYPQITTEVADFIEAEGSRRGYAFVGRPLARFMVDPSLRSGKFAVFAENIDERTLSRLRHEEEAFLSRAATVGGAAAVPTANPVEISRGKQRPHRRGAKLEPVVEPMPEVEPQPEAIDAAPAPDPLAPVEPEHATPVPSLSADHLRDIPVTDPVTIPVMGSPLSDDSAGLGVIPTDFVDSQYADVLAPSPAPMPTPEPAPIPVTQRRAQPQPAPAPTPQAPASCQLIDHQTGRTYTATAPSAFIGRERTSGGIVLRDPNVSRRHAQLFYDGRCWSIQDLQSTNGTLVNDVDINECMLRDGDLITIGLMNLEFREI